MALLLHLGSKRRTKPSFFQHHLFSTSDNESTKSPFSAFFADVKDNLKQRSPSSSPSKPLNFSLPASPNLPQASLDEIQKNLSQFRARTAVPPPGEPLQQISFQEFYHRREKEQGASTNFDQIRESLKNIGDRRGGNRISAPGLRDILKVKPPSGSNVIGGTSVLPESVFGKEKMRERKEGDVTSVLKMGFMRTYGHKELGEKLRMLRPEGKAKGKDWFSLEELSERLVRLREMEEKETSSNIITDAFRDCLIQMHETKDDKSNKASMGRFNILGHLGATPTFPLGPPKEHLVEKYFHPDNMSSEEKMKIELAKVRDEFKMSESDCGSARVQVAQLTTKIKHLSTVLHKKDVHSRKGLLAMVQRRKKLLKYLRRTDWDSYCFVISKLGLRDNPDHSFKIRSGLAAKS